MGGGGANSFFLPQELMSMGAAQRRRKWSAVLIGVMRKNWDCLKLESPVQSF